MGAPGIPKKSKTTRLAQEAMALLFITTANGLVVSANTRYEDELTRYRAKALDSQDGFPASSCPSVLHNTNPCQLALHSHWHIDQRQHSPVSIV